MNQAIREHAETLRQLASDVRRIGCAFRANPETIAIQKDAVAKQLVAVAADLERAA